MPEKSSLYPDYSVTGFLRFYHRASGFRNDEVFQALGLEKVSRQKIKHLSKGWHQRLKLYVALASPRPTAVLDEPFEGFDPLQMQEIAKLLRKQNQAGKNFILSIHQLAYAEAICSHFIFLNQGCIIARGTLTELAAAYNTPNDLQEIFLQALKKW
jgi:ABC-2 type transport system ATP-binding protein